MKSKKTIIIISTVLTIAVAIILTLTLVCVHSWTEATCSTPITCEKCGETQGVPLEHEWIAATCK